MKTTSLPASSFSALCLVAIAGLAGCMTRTKAPAPTEVTAPPAAAAPAPVVAEQAQPAVAQPVALREWTFADGSTGGWRLGWNSSEDTAATEMSVEPGLGLKVTVNFQSKDWGDANLKVQWPEEPLPQAINLRVLVPAANGRPRGPMQIGCALNSPWSETKHWPDLRLPEQITIAGKPYLAQTVTCRIGSATGSPKDLILRLGGNRVRYQGPLYLQQIRALRSAS